MGEVFAYEYLHPYRLTPVSGTPFEILAASYAVGDTKAFTSEITLDDLENAIGYNKYLIIATLEAYKKYISYYGKEMIIPIYIEVDDKTRIHRAISREDTQAYPKYAEMCRRFLADEEDFSEEKLTDAGITKRYTNDVLLRCVEEIIADMN